MKYDCQKLAQYLIDSFMQNKSTKLRIGSPEKNPENTPIGVYEFEQNWEKKKDIPKRMYIPLINYLNDLALITEEKLDVKNIINWTYNEEELELSFKLNEDLQIIIEKR